MLIENRSLLPWRGSGDGVERLLFTDAATAVILINPGDQLEDFQPTQIGRL
jgi:hypothetical protein